MSKFWISCDGKTISKHATGVLADVYDTSLSPIPCCICGCWSICLWGYAKVPTFGCDACDREPFGFLHQIQTTKPCLALDDYVPTLIVGCFFRSVTFTLPVAEVGWSIIYEDADYLVWGNIIFESGIACAGIGPSHPLCGDPNPHIFPDTRSEDPGHGGAPCGDASVLWF